MTYDLYIGDRTFSSWSLRGWLMLEKFGLPYTSTLVGLYSGTMAAELAHLPGVKTVHWPARSQLKCTAASAHCATPARITWITRSPGLTYQKRCKRMLIAFVCFGPWRAKPMVPTVHGFLATTPSPMPSTHRLPIVSQPTASNCPRWRRTMWTRMCRIHQTGNGARWAKP